MNQHPNCEQEGLEGAKKRAMGYLERRAYSKRELSDKLVEKGVSRDLAEEAVDWLEEINFLNDEDYARQIVQHYSAKGYGRRRVEQELWRRGIEKPLWESALAQAMPEEQEDAIDGFIQRKLRGAMPDSKEEKRVADALARRGYQWDEIRGGLARYKDSLEG